VTARDLAADVAARVREHTVLDALVYSGGDATDGHHGRCPRCGRALPIGSVGPEYMVSAVGAIGFPRTTAELTAACLVDGARARHAEDLALDDLLDAARDIAAALRQRGWKHWAAWMDRALENSHDRNEQAEAVGQTLQLMRRTGPAALRTGPEVEVLVTSLARYWPHTPPPAAGT
jgi:hypothetical protein